ncbi:wax ester/triacylglycerol synthase family O-acyltransferase [Pseudoduganella sp. GCM10020061]|uniref:wax ester/triacylglycerol synthase family O-acyltransferase n=1 Tax=Pseudoduganella sp. GCM10020061 TaxID=3317345 RepID=UPI003638B1A7
MDYLSGLNASFLHLETPSVPMHAGSLLMLDVPDERRTGFLDELQRYVTTRMPAVPLLTRKLQPIPFGLSNPVWITDENVDLDHHVRSHTLAGEGSMHDLERLVATLHAVPLDRSRPLWELHLVDGLKEGRLALYAKFHHAALEGIGATAIMQALAETVPGAGSAAPADKAAPAPGHAPGPMSLLASSLAHAVGQAFDMARHMPEGLRTMASMRGRMPSAAPRTPFNVSVGAERVFATLQLPLDELSLAARAYAGTVNDALLAVVDGALRRYLQAHGATPDRALVAAVPVSLRERDGGHLSSQVSLWRTELATAMPDAGSRMRAIVHHTHAMRSEVSTLRPLVLSDFPGLGVPWMMGGAAMVAEHARLAENMPPLANLIVSHVAGPAHPPHIAGAGVLATYPVSIVTHGLALNITAQSCCDMLDIGIVAAAVAVPDVQRLVDDLRAAHAELLAAARALEPEPLPDTDSAHEGKTTAGKAGESAAAGPPPASAGAARRNGGAAPAASRGARSKRG